MSKVPFGPITGLDERHFPPSGSLATAINVRVDDQDCWAQCRGVTELFKYSGMQPSPLTGLGPIESMSWFSQHQGGRQWLVWEQKDSGANQVTLYAFDGPNRAKGTIRAGRKYHAGPWLRTRYLAHNDWLYYVNGYDLPERWNGRWKTQIGFLQAAAAPTIVATTLKDWLWCYWGASATASSIVNGRGRRGVGPWPENGNSATGPALVDTFYKYVYGVTYQNDLNQESPLSSVVVTSQSASGYDAGGATDYLDGRYGNLVAMPDPPSNVRSMRLWRSMNVVDVADPASLPQTKMYLLAEFPAAIGCLYADLKADDELGRELDQSQLGPFPKSARMLAMFRNRMFVAMATGNTSTVQYSANGFIEQFPADNVLPIGDSDSGHITGMYAMKDALVVTKERGVYLVKQQVDGFFRAETLTEDSGNSSAGCLVEVPGKGLLLVSTAGIHILSGALAAEGVPTRIETAFDVRVRDSFRTRVSTSSLVTAFAIVNHQDGEVWIQLPEDGDVRPTFGLVYHYEADAWSVREGWAMSAGLETHDHRAVVYFGSNTADEDGVYQIYQYTNSEEVATQPFMKAAPMTKRGSQMVWTGADVYTVNFGSGRSLAMSAYINRRVRAETANAESRAQIDTESEDIPGEWGTAQWGTGYWGDQLVQPVRYSVYPPGSPTDVQWGITGTRFAVFGLDLDIAADQKHKIDQSIDTPWT